MNDDRFTFKITSQWLFNGKPNITREEHTGAVALLDKDTDDEKYIDRLLSRVKIAALKELQDIRKQLKEHEQ